MADLNPHQNKAVHTLRGPLLVLAGAGSGKTRVITFRIAELIRNGIKPSRILAVTFTNKAAREMKHRAVELLGQRRRSKEAPEISTFHSLCVRILRRNIDRLGYPKNFPIYDGSDQDALARSALRDIKVSQETLRPRDLLTQISTWKSQGVRPAQAEALCTTDKELLAARAYERYQNQLKACGALDFDDLLLCTEELFRDHPDVRFSEASRFDHLLIDEYQDTNALQYRIVRELARGHKNLCVVGDDDQSIYGWRGAEVEHILGFTKDWPDATVVYLEDNYRSRESILNLANTLIAHNKERHPKVLRAARKAGEPPRFCRFDDETQEAESIVREIAGLVQTESADRVKPSDIAILFRTNEQPRIFEQELRRHKIPYTIVGGMSFYDRREVRDVMSYLRVLAHPTDEVSLLRIINTPARGIGDGSVEALMKLAVSRAVTLWDVLPDAQNHPDVAFATGERIAKFQAMIQRYQERLQSEPLLDVARALIGEVEYKREIERLYKSATDIESRWRSIEELMNAIGIYQERSEEPSLRGFLEETALGARDDFGDDKDKREKHALTLMTLHSAKGLEFPRVYMVGMEEGLLPHQRSLLDGGNSIAEERRLAYVGVTRAKDRLTLSLAKQRMKWGKARPTIVSRFLLEMRGETEKAKLAAQAAEELVARMTQGAQERGASKASETSTAAKSAGAKPAAKKPGSAKPSATRASSSSAGATRASTSKATRSSGASEKARRTAARAASVGRG
ncbi:MAG TPA: UvrD-helicase domain-containing protein [Polyangiaceae bacterium]|jgi:DNA helicase-2/ATP-dependent DNA helicase PcrA|nr:UvrD-helicase domain-containing protein [Polyangiaceae bacterium]